MNLRLQSIVCPGCHHNVPRETEVCVICGHPTSIVVSAEIESVEVAKSAILAYQMAKGHVVVDVVRHDYVGQALSAPPPSEVQSGRVSPRGTERGELLSRPVAKETSSLLGQSILPLAL